MDQLKDLLSDVAGLEIKTVGNKVVFEGKIETQADCEKIKKVEAAYPGADQSGHVRPAGMAHEVNNRHDPQGPAMTWVWIR